MSDLHDGLQKLNRDLNEKESRGKKTIREYTEALLTAVLLAFFIRSFVIEPFKIPSKSMVPTLLVGDHIFVNKFSYGLRIPWTKKWIFRAGDPHRGDVIVFIYPEDERLDFIKRVVGLPGDRIRIYEGKLFVNGEEVVDADIPVLGVDSHDKRFLRIGSVEAAELPQGLKKIPFYRGYENFRIQMESLNQKKFLIQKSRLFPVADDMDIEVPPHHFFVLGDNRDQSADSRVWGFVPRENLKGRALFIWLSLDHEKGGLRLKRFGKKII